MCTAPSDWPFRGRLLVNADDFGLTDGVCRGILQAHRQGIVSSTSVMVCAPGAQERIARFVAAGLPPALDMVLHLQLTRGAPCLPANEIPLLVTDKGMFPGSPRDMRTPHPDLAGQIHAEWLAQHERMLSLGLRPVRVDSHHHVHAREDIFPVYCEMAKSLALGARGYDDRHRDILRFHGVWTADHFERHWTGERISVPGFVETVGQAFFLMEKNNISQGVLELMTHPGDCDQALESISSYATMREAEKRTLCDPELKRALARMRVLAPTFE